MRTRLLASFIALTLGVGVPSAPASPQPAAPATKAGISIPLNVTDGGVSFNGVLRVQRFGIDGTTLVASGVLTGTIVDAAEKSTPLVRNVSLPVTQGEPGGPAEPPTPAPPSPAPPSPAPPSPSPTTAEPSETASGDEPGDAPAIACSALHLELGPLALDLLGTEVPVERVLLDIEASPVVSASVRSGVCELTSGGGISTLPLQRSASLLNRILRGLS